METTRKFAVVLAGCGVYDGAEIQEAVMTLYAIDRSGNSFGVFAPDVPQHHVVNHLTGKPMDEKRNVLTESARIARGKIRPLKEFKSDEFDILIFPGGFGVAKNLCTFAFDGANCKVNPEVEMAVIAMHKAGKPIGALCIAPVLLAKILGDVTLTIGQDAGTAAAVTAMGATHKPTTHREVIIDKKNKIVTSPCYMLDAGITDIAEGALNAVNALLAL
ncbi:MAG: isoprenoid biosynthesis protein ElbB [Bacteroidetes bacterium GWF2_49_14]|nr:MAG: isoprenoid biosynthesis protein ElbB [Bacteroidetes bacterium GWF2_49_14]